MSDPRNVRLAVSRAASRTFGVHSHAFVRRGPRRPRAAHVGGVLRRAGCDNRAVRDTAAGLVRELRAHVADERVLEAIADTPRDAFVPQALRGRAWENVPLPIGDGQTISQPLAVAHMCELLGVRATDRVLDVGTGSGYHAAVLARLGAHVDTIEVRPGLAAPALALIGNVTAHAGDGTAGLPERAPFDAVNVAAACGREDLRTLLGQLAPGGRLVAPIGADRQTLMRYERGRGWTEHGPVRFVPLVCPS